MSSPEQIAGRLHRKHPQYGICVESIYQFIYDPEVRDRSLEERMISEIASEVSLKLIALASLRDMSLTE